MRQALEICSLVRELMQQTMALSRQLLGVLKNQPVVLVYNQLRQALEVNGAYRQATPEHINDLHRQVQVRGRCVETDAEVSRPK